MKCTMRKAGRTHLIGLIGLLVLLLCFGVIAEPCHQNVSENDSVKSENYPNPFMPKTCVYDVTVENSRGADYIVLIFDEFDINSEAVQPMLQMNEIQVHDKDANLLGAFKRSVPSGIVAPVSDKKSAVSLKITFLADHNQNMTGFTGHFQLKNYSEIVGKTAFRETRGIISSPGYPYTYPSHIYVKYSIYTPNDYGVVRFTFEDYSMGPDSSLSVYDGEETSHRYRVYNFPSETELRKNWYFYVSSNKMAVVFRAGGGVTASGFNMTFTEYCEYNNVDTPCDRMPVLSVLWNITIIGAGLGGLLFFALAIVGLCVCTRKLGARRRRQRGSRFP